MGLWKYCLVSTLMCGCMIVQTAIEYPNYFSALVGVADSVVKTAILINFACCLTALWTKFVIHVFLTTLTDDEVQILYQRGWLYLCNSILYLGTFNRKIYENPYNIAVCMLSVFVLLVLQWVCTARVRRLSASLLEFDRASIIRTLKLAILCTVLLAVDIGTCMSAVIGFRRHDYTLALFMFSLIDLTEMAVVCVGELGVNLYAAWYLMHNDDEDEWYPAKLLVAALKFVGSLAAISGHVVFTFAVGSQITDFMTLFFRTLRLFNNSKALWTAWHATSELTQFTESAAPADLARDNTCVICRDSMDCNEPEHSRHAPKRLRCGHVMHARCLLSWLAQSASCPTCRQPARSAVSSFRGAEQQDAPQQIDEDEVVEAAPMQEVAEEIPGVRVESEAEAECEIHMQTTVRISVDAMSERGQQPIRLGGMLAGQYEFRYVE